MLKARIHTLYFTGGKDIQQNPHGNFTLKRKKHYVTILPVYSFQSLIHLHGTLSLALKSKI